MTLIFPSGPKRERVKKWYYYEEQHFCYCTFVHQKREKERNMCCTERERERELRQGRVKEVKRERVSERSERERERRKIRKKENNPIPNTINQF